MADLIHLGPHDDQQLATGYPFIALVVFYSENTTTLLVV